MLRSTRIRAEKAFTASQKKDKRDLKEKAKARQVRAEKTARLRALRLAKERSDTEASNSESARKRIR